MLHVWAFCILVLHLSCAVLDEQQLRRMYLDEQLPVRVIASQLGLPSHAVYMAMIRWHIPRRSSAMLHQRPATERFPFDEATLRALYSDGSYTMKEIAQHFHVTPSRVWTAMRYWNIPRRRAGPRPLRGQAPEQRFPFDAATLRALYSDAGQTIQQIAQHFQIPTSSVVAAMKYWDIPRRRSGPRSERFSSSG